MNNSLSFGSAFITFILKQEIYRDKKINFFIFTDYYNFQIDYLGLECH